MCPFSLEWTMKMSYRFEGPQNAAECVNVALQHVQEYEHFKDAITLHQTHRHVILWRELDLRETTGKEMHGWCVCVCVFVNMNVCVCMHKQN